MQTEQYIPRKCVFEATLACNLRCRHCGSRAGKRRADELSTAEAKDLFGQLAELGCQKITISGGEPLMRPDWSELITAAARTGMHVGLITNAVAFDLDAARLARDSGLRAVGFSLDGPRAVHDKVRGRVGHFTRLMAAMDAANSARLPFAVVSFIGSQNIDLLDEMYTIVEDKGAYAWQVQLGTDMGNLHDNRDLLVSPLQLPKLQRALTKLIKRDGLRIDVSDSIGYYGQHEKILRRSAGGRTFRGCGAGLRVIGIESNGNVKGCLSIMPGYNPEGADFVEGNIREESLAEIWHREGAFSYNRDWSRDQMEGFCRECKHVSKCRGGCRAKMVASRRGNQNPMCVYRVTCEEAAKGRAVGHAAAVVLATLIGGTQACQDDGDGGAKDGGAHDGTDQDASVDTGTEFPTDMTDYGMPEYGFEPEDTASETGSDTDVDSDTEVPTDMMEYGFESDSDVSDYDMPIYSFIEE